MPAAPSIGKDAPRATAITPTGIGPAAVQFEQARCQALDLEQQLIGVDRLDEVVIGAGAQAVEAALAIPGSADDDHTAAVALAQLTCQIEVVGIR